MLHGVAADKGAQGRNVALAEAKVLFVGGRVDDRAVLLGNAKLMRERGIAIEALIGDWEGLAGEGKTPMYVAADGKALGLVAVADTVKPDLKAAIEALKHLGIEVVMLTGDQRAHRQRHRE